MIHIRKDLLLKNAQELPIGLSTAYISILSTMILFKEQVDSITMVYFSLGIAFFALSVFIDSHI